MLPDAVLQKLEALPAQAGRLPLQGQEGGRRLRRQGQEPALRACAATSRTSQGDDARLHPDPAADHRRPRDHRHGEREGGDDPREQPHQGAPAPLQRQAPRRQGLHHAAARTPIGAGRASWPRLEVGAPAQSPTARATSARTTRRPRRGARFTSSTSTSSCGRAATSSSRAAGGRACSTRSSAAPRRACFDGRPAPGTPSRSTPSPSSSRGATTSCRASSTSQDEAGRARHALRARRRLPRPAPRHREGARGAARRDDRRRRSRRPRPLPRGRARRDRAPPRARRQARGRRHVLASSRPRSPTRRSSRRSSPQHYGASLDAASEDEADAARPRWSPTRSSCRASPRASPASPSGSPIAPGTRWRCCSRKRGHRVELLAHGARQRAPLVRREAAHDATTCRSACAISRSGCACRRSRAASSAATSRTSAAATPSAPSSR